MEVIKNRLNESKGKTVTIFLHNDFRYTGRCTNSDDKWVEILDFKTNKIMLFEIENIKMVEVGE